MSQFLDQMMVRPSISAGPRSCSLSLFAVLGSVFIVTSVLLSNLPALGGFLTELASTNSRGDLSFMEVVASPRAPALRAQGARRPKRGQ